METGTHFYLAKKFHALNSNRVEKKTLFFSTCVVRKKLKNDMFRAFFTIRFEIFHFLLFFFLFNIEMFITTSDPWATLLSSLAQQ